MPRILIVCNNGSDTERLETIFQELRWATESATTIAAGCELAKSGRFQVVLSTLLLPDGSWRRLIDVANDHGLSFQVILLARISSLNQWAEALQAGAFDVLDVLCDLPQAGEAARRALEASWKRFRATSRPAASVH